MRIVIICDYAHAAGGLEKVAIDSACGLARRGFSVDFFAAVGPVAAALVESGVNVRLLGQPDVRSAPSFLRFGAQWLWNAEAARALSAHLTTCDPAATIVHVHGWSKALSPSIGEALRHAGLPVVHTLHDYYLACPNGGFYDFGKARNCDYVAMSSGCIAHNCDSRGYHRKLMRVFRHAVMLYASRLHESARHVVTISKLQREVMTPYLPKDATCYDVSNPIDVPDLGPKGDAPLGDFVFFGRLSPEKGARYFAEAAAIAGVRPVFIGDGPERQTLRKAFPQARFLGWRSAREVRDLLRSARALVFPSIWYEGQPLSIYEALALGTPVIVSDLCAGREAVTHGETGLWFKSADVRALSDAMTQLCDDVIARRMGRAAYERYWADPLTLDRHLDRIGEVYRLVRLSSPLETSRAAPVDGAAH